MKKCNIYFENMLRPSLSSQASCGTSLDFAISSYIEGWRSILPCHALSSVATAWTTAFSTKGMRSTHAMALARGGIQLWYALGACHGVGTWVLKVRYAFERYCSRLVMALARASSTVVCARGLAHASANTGSFHRELSRHLPLWY